jgi:hypothetical protein
MAYMNQQRKADRMPAIRAALNKYGMKGSVSVRNHSTLVVTVREGEIDFGSDYHQVNPYWIEEHYEGVARAFLLELKDAMLGDDYYDRSDVQSDYFDTSHYVSINVGDWNKPYVCTDRELA